MGLAAQGVGRGGGGAAGVAVEIDENATLAVILAHDGDEGVGGGLGEQGGDGAGGGVYRLPAEPGLQRDDEVEALAAGGFHEGDEADAFEFALEVDGGLDDLAPLDAFARIEVEDDAVGLFEVAQVGAPGVELDAAELR